MSLRWVRELQAWEGGSSYRSTGIQQRKRRGRQSDQLLSITTTTIVLVELVVNNEGVQAAYASNNTYAYLVLGIGLPFLVQVMVGCGLPAALQKKLTTPSDATAASRGA